MGYMICFKISLLHNMVFMLIMIIKISITTDNGQKCPWSNQTNIYAKNLSKFIWLKWLKLIIDVVVLIIFLNIILI